MSLFKAPSLGQLRRYAIARSLFKPTSLPRALAHLGFVQADPLRAPARAQDLILAHRVKDYCAGELERRYPRLAIEEVFFVNYGFVPRETVPLLHPHGAHGWDARMEAHRPCRSSVMTPHPSWSTGVHRFSTGVACCAMV